MDKTYEFTFVDHHDGNSAWANGNDTLVAILVCSMCKKRLHELDFVRVEVKTGHAFCSDKCIDDYKIMKVTKKLDDEQNTMGTGTMGVSYAK